MQIHLSYNRKTLKLCVFTDQVMTRDRFLNKLRLLQK
jgi:hypothetical protein